MPRLGLRWPGFRRVRAQVRKRLQRRLRALQLEGLADYRERLESDPAEWGELDAMCAITISRFWRDAPLFEALRDVVIPELAVGGRLRCWSAGAASGEEPYSLALMQRHAFPELGFEIVASERDPAMIERMRRGRYRVSSLRELPTGWREGSFTPDGSHYRLDADLRSRVKILAGDLREALPDGPFDLVLCRNLAFTYFDEASQSRFLDRLAERTVGGAALAVGRHERLPVDVGGWEAWPGLRGIFRRRGDD